MNITINDVFKYFISIDNIERDDLLNHDEFIKAKQTNSIFSSILEENMSFKQYCTTFVNKYRGIIDNGNANEGKNLPYRMENMAEVQPCVWEPITRVLTQDEVNENIFNIKTPEGQKISSSINFNTEEGLYMLKHLSYDEEAFRDFPIENLPEGWNPKEILELGKDPGMNVKKIHAMGYTGKDVTVAIVDTPIIMHNEIKSSIVGYEVMNNSLALDPHAYFHGQAVSSILCGDETGIAPDSKLVYFAAETTKNDRFQALKRIIEINTEAENNNQAENKIKVVSLSWEINKGMEGYDEFRKLLKELYENGVFVVTGGFNMIDESITGGKFARCSLEKKDQQGDPNDYSNYIPVYDIPDYPESTLFVLTGDKTVASATNPNSFRHDSQESTSWGVPTLAGIYTCALQCAEKNGIELTPKLFWDYAYKTGKEIYENGEMVGKAVDAEALINAILQDTQIKRKPFGL